MKSSRLPIQSAPVERTITGAAVSNGNGVDPSFDWGGLLKTVGNVAATALPAVLGAI
ncbi:MAG: hypothetical protein KAF91_26945 [Nostoc sp. TH1S01]|nr:hypothetical protein [Nostoc sp. TH1S01]